MGSVTKMSPPLPSGAHKLAPSEPEPGMCVVTVMARSTRPCPPAAWAGLLRQCWSDLQKARGRMVFRLFLRPPLPGGRVRVPRVQQCLEQGRQRFYLPPAGDRCVGCLAYFLLPTAPYQEAWGSGEDPGPCTSA